MRTTSHAFLALFLIIVPTFLVARPAAAAAASTSAQSLIAEARAKHISSDPYWRTLLHYRRNFWLRMRSDMSDKRFFLSPRGATDPEAELEATLAAFFEPIGKDTAAHAQCRFIARYHWLKEKISFPDHFPEATCGTYDEWAAKVAPTSMSLIFSSYYLNNPASMYGHTFLKLNKSDHAGSDLLNYTVNYAAQVKLAGIFYPILGLAGGYKGSFTVLPYYVKVQQYNNMESRDLWEYHLRFTPADLQRLFFHLWELQDLRKPYFFINKNCSYELLPLLDIAEPGLHLANHFIYRVVPVDTLLLIKNTPGLVTDVRFRPSHLRKIMADKAAFSPQERRWVDKIADGKLSPASDEIRALAPDRQAELLEASYDLMKFRYGFLREDLDEISKREQTILTLRSQLPASNRPEPDLSVGVTPPDQGHLSGRIGFGGGLANEGKAFQELSLRPALHDAAEDPAGYLSGQLEMFHLKIRHQDDGNHFFLDNFSVINVAALSTFDAWTRPMAWAFALDVKPAYDLPKDPWLTEALTVAGGPGIAVNVFDESTKLYVLAPVEAAAGHGFDQGYRLGGGGEAGLLFHFGRVSWVHVSASAMRFPSGDVGNRVQEKYEQSFPLGKKTLLRFEFRRDDGHHEGLISLHRYY